MENLEINGKVPYLCSALTDIRLTPSEIHWELANFVDERRCSEVFSSEAPREGEDEILKMFGWYAEGKGPLADAEREKVQKFKHFLERIANDAEGLLGVRPFVPHEHFDPILNGSATPTQVRDAEGRQIKESTSCLLVVATNPSWGGGMEVAWAEEGNIPTIIMRTSRVSRLLLGTRTLCSDIVYENEADLQFKLEGALRHVFQLALI